MECFSFNGKTAVLGRTVMGSKTRWMVYYYNGQYKGQCACQTATNHCSTKMAAKAINKFLGSEVVYAFNDISVMLK